MNVLQSLQDIITKKYSIPPERITPDATLDGLGIDSLELIETLFEVEDAFHIRIPQDGSVTLKISTIQDIVDVVNYIIEQQRPSEMASGA